LKYLSFGYRCILLLIYICTEISKSNESTVTNLLRVNGNNISVIRGFAFTTLNHSDEKVKKFYVNMIKK